jgi:hypothetical protein
MERVKCNFNTQGVMGPTASNTLGCYDGYVSSTTSECVGTCGIGLYGGVTYDWRAVVETSTCYTCSANCYECIDSGASKCISCKAGYYLQHTSYAVSYGTCVAKSGTTSFTIYV